MSLIIKLRLNASVHKNDQTPKTCSNLGEGSIFPLYFLPPTPPQPIPSVILSIYSCIVTTHYLPKNKRLCHMESGKGLHF